MTHKNTSNFNTLKNSGRRTRNKELIGVTSILINSLATVVEGKELSDHANEFISKVLAAFHETYESRSDVVRAWKKQFCIRLLKLAYDDEDQVARKRTIDYTIQLIEQWKLSLKPLSKTHKANLHAPKPRIGPGKSSSLQLVLSRLDSMFEYSISEYHRDNRRWPGLGKKVNTHYANTLDMLGVFIYTMSLVFELKDETINKLCEILRDDGYLKEQRPLNNGQVAHEYFKTMNLKMRMPKRADS